VEGSDGACKYCNPNIVGVEKDIDTDLIDFLVS
jgi:hypothetical protein